jgi:hypothetical protein
MNNSIIYYGDLILVFYVVSLVAIAVGATLAITNKKLSLLKNYFYLSICIILIFFATNKYANNIYIANGYDPYSDYHYFGLCDPNSYFEEHLAFYSLCIRGRSESIPEAVKYCVDNGPRKEVYEQKIAYPDYKSVEFCYRYRYNKFGE